MAYRNVWNVATERFTADSFPWLTVCMLPAAGLQVIAFLLEFGSGRPELSADSALYEHGGWYMIQGATPYVDIWDAKPPLAFELPALVAALFGWNPYLYHLVMVVLTAAATLGVVLVCALIVREVTGDVASAGLTAIAGGAFPYLYYYSAAGFRPKLFMLVFGFTALYLGLRDRPLLAGALAAASAGLWQLALVFPCVILGLSVQRSGRRGVLRTLSGMAAVTVLAVAPIAIAGGFFEMLVEVVIIPLTDSESQTVVEAVLKSALMYGFAVPLVILGVGGAVVNAFRSKEEFWWLGVLAVWFAFQVYIDLNYFPDLFQLFMVALIGFGVFVATRDVDLRIAVTIGLCLILVFNPLLAFGVFTGGSYLPVQISRDLGISSDAGETQNLPEPFYNVSQKTYMNQIFWEQEKPEYCHYRFGEGERKWLALTGGTYRSKCGTLPPNWKSIVF